jgi:hypothetical protein
MAALGAVGVASSMGQSAVYSVNIVGYINKTIPSGGSTLANQLNASPNNTIPTLLGTPAGAMTIFKFNPATANYDQAFFDPDAGAWDNTTMVLNPGQGAFIDNNGPAHSITLVGEVQLNSTVDIHPGYDAYSSVIPRSGPLDASMNFPVPTEAMTVFRFNGSGYTQYFNDPDSGGWQPPNGVPSVNIAEAFYIDNSSATTHYSWTVNFPVGP